MAGRRTTSRIRCAVLLGAASLGAAYGTASAKNRDAQTAPVDRAANLIADARREGKVVVYSVLSTKAARPLIEDFQALYPGIVVDYDGDMGSNEMDARYRREDAAGQPTADSVWSSSTDMQMKLVSQGYAATYRSPEKSALPHWADFRDMAYGTTLEPAVFVYNKTLTKLADVPQDHTQFAQMLNADPARYRGRVTGFDIAASGVGLMFAVQDHQHLRTMDALLDAFGRACFVPSSGTGDMLVGINRGTFLLGYDIMGAYALSRSHKDLPNLGVVLPRDFTLLLSRVAFVGARARHPAAARLWLNYLLSARGQRVLSDQVDLYPVRRGVDGRLSAEQLYSVLGKRAQPVPVNTSLAKTLDPQFRTAFIDKWNGGIAAGRPTDCPVTAPKK